MDFLFIAIQAITWVIIIDAVSSWFLPPGQFPRSMTSQLTEPLYRPVRSILDPGKMGGLDLSPMVVILALQVLASALARALH